MDYKVCTGLETEKVAMRDVYASTMIELASQNDKIVALDADLMNSVGMVKFAKAFPGRIVDCGIMEANMMGVASGMSAVGLIPYAHTFACFATRRALDQIFVSAAFARNNIRIIGSDPGITAAFNGATHMPFEDIGTLRDVPGVTIIEPTDSVMLEDIIRQLEKKFGVFYVRLSRKNAIKIFEDKSTFEIGKAAPLREGKDVTIIASGICVAEALKAASILKEQNISAAVLNMFTIKPVDREAIEQAAIKTGAIVTAENHNIYNGLGSAVAEALVETHPVPMERVGVQDHFGEVGSVDYLRNKFGLSANAIAEKAIKAIQRKKNGG
ncbi:transketolase family protein [Brenneria izadpanahii]|uniref:Transketolase family protein n=1 Tax=Brenneria izadpanahii TaxID=2722756 RepID=A0ABX7UTI2_9GAMM|nr:transketolase C-terminal domain-containing protein [Brenneria izadpanahii]QTF08996.1 transketolase family protein [Brenneria izadpanahii]